MSQVVPEATLDKPQFPSAYDRDAFRSLYGDLRRIASRLMEHVAWGEHSLEPTGLVNEAFLRLFRGGKAPHAADRDYLVAASMRAMRRILVERARARNRHRRGGRWRRMPLEGLLDHPEGGRPDWSNLHEALERLAGRHPRPAEVLSMRFYAGLTIKEIAAHFGLSVSTIESDLAFARAWLRRELTS